MNILYCITGSRAATDNDAYQLQELLHHQHRIEVPIKCLEGKLYVRISCHVYNHLEEYKKLGQVINEIYRPGSR